MAEDESETPEWEDVIREALDARLLDVHVALPGRAEADASGGTCPVKPLVRRTVRTQSGGTAEESLPVIPSVPIAILRAGAAFVSVPVKAGDHGLLIVCSASIDRYRALGEDAPAGDVRLHGLSGAVFWPGGVVPRSQALTSDDPDNIVIGFEGGSTIHVRPDGEIHLGSDPAADFVALAAKVLAELGAVKGAYDAHTHPGVTAGAAVTGPPAPLLPAPGSVAAAKVRAD